MKNITINGRELTFNNISGKVAETSKNMETKISGGGGGGSSFRGTGYNAPVRITSTTIVHDQIFLIDNSGQEHSFQLKGMDVACREGNELTITGVTKPGKNQVSYIAAMNKTTGYTFFNKAVIQMLHWPPRTHLFFFMGAMFLLMFFKGAGFMGSIFGGAFIGGTLFLFYAAIIIRSHGKRFISNFRAEDYN